MRPAPIAACLVVALGSACVSRVIHDAGAADGSGSGSGDVPSGATSTGVDTTTGPTRAEAVLDIAVVHDLDLLFIVDNSSTMGDEQGTLTANAAAFLEILEAAGTNYRIAVTTTDASAPPCEEFDNNSPEYGAFMLRNCREHFGEFTSNAGDVFRKACGDHCLVEGIEVLATATEVDATLRPRPWIERVGGVTNVDPEVSMAEALACFLPQGVAGCRFESPLESMRLAIRRSLDPGDPAFGFIRGAAHLAVVLVTDEVDCSVAEPAIFDADGDKVFWQDPDRPIPSSAMCWAAGVSCLGPGPTYPDCRSVNKAVDGTEGVPDAASVMHPVSRYVDLLAEVRARKQAFHPDVGVTVTGITGVPEDYPAAGIVYAEGTDDRFRRAFGIGPGCQNDHAEAVPPVRIRDVVRRGGDAASVLVSVCGDDFTPALSAIAERIGVGDPLCVPLCVADVDPAPGLQTGCDVVERWPGGEAVVPPCGRAADQWILPDGAQACNYPRTGEERSPACATALELGMLRGAPARDDTTWHVTCDVDPTC